MSPIPDGDSTAWLYRYVQFLSPVFKKDKLILEQ